MREIVQEKGLREEDQYEKVVESAFVLDLSDGINYERIVDRVAGQFAERLDLSKILLLDHLIDVKDKALPVGKSAAIKHAKLDKEIETTAALVRIRPGIEIEEEMLESNEEGKRKPKINCLVFLISPKRKADQM